MQDEGRFYFLGFFFFYNCRDPAEIKNQRINAPRPNKIEKKCINDAKFTVRVQYNQNPVKKLCDCAYDGYYYTHAAARSRIPT